MTRPRTSLWMGLVIVPLAVGTVIVTRSLRGLRIDGEFLVSWLTGSPIGWATAVLIVAWVVAVVALVVRRIRRPPPDQED